jgi:hypothetical protein
MVLATRLVPPEVDEAGADAAGLLPDAAGLPELPQAETTRAIAASPAAPHIFRIRSISPSQCI